LLSAIVEALRSAGATEEIIAAAVKAGGELGNSPRRQRGRRREHADDAERQLAWRRRNEIRDEIQARNEIRNENPVAGAPFEERGSDLAAPRPSRDRGRTAKPLSHDAALKMRRQRNTLA
jgi:hypothetical protein